MSLISVNGTVEPNPALGIVLKMTAVTAFVVMQTAIKSAGEGMPAGQIAFFRSFFALIPVIGYLAWLGDLRTALRTDDLLGHFWRGIIGVTAMALGFFALTRLPYPEWTAINYATPLLTVLFAAIFLRETVRLYRWSAVVIGLVGVMIVLLPNLSLLERGMDATQALGAMSALGSAVVGAVAMIQVRRLVRTEKTATIVVYFTITCSFFALLTSFFGWIRPTPLDALLLILAGLFGGVGQLCLTAAYRYADTATVAPFDYLSMLFAIAIGFFLFSEVPTLTTLSGAGIISAAGIFIIYRERQLGIERAKSRRASSTQP